jgi:hypothetical protein
LAACPPTNTRRISPRWKNRKVAEAVAYLNAINKTVTPAEIYETRIYTIPYLRLLKAIQLSISAPTMMGAEVKADPDFWTYGEFKAFEQPVLVRLFHPLLHAGLARRTVIAILRQLTRLTRRAIRSLPTLKLSLPVGFRQRQ